VHNLCEVALHRLDGGRAFPGLHGVGRRAPELERPAEERASP
jgi:hypothetical protein